MKRGFTLIELLVYIAILALALGVVVLSVLSFGRAYRRVQARAVLAASGAGAMERMVREARDAESLNVPASTLGTSPGHLVLSIPLASGGTKTAEFSVSGGGVSLAEDGSITGTLTQANVWVDSLVFQRIQTQNSEAIKIDLTLSSAPPGSATTSASFHSTAVLRGSYAL